MASRMLDDSADRRLRLSCGLNALSVGAIGIVKVGRQNVDVNKFARIRSIPLGGRIFNWVTADGDDQVGGIQQPVRGLVRKLADPPAKIIEEMGPDGACGLESTYHGQIIPRSVLSCG